jgi:Flp pilus assembly protein TadG
MTTPERRDTTTPTVGARGDVAPNRTIKHHTIKQRTATRRSERGEVSASNVIIIPLVMLLCFAVIQYAVAWHARNALNAAAEDGLRAAQTNTLIDPTAVAQTSLNANAAFIANVAVIQRTPAPGRLTITVTGNVVGPFPGLTWSLTGQATGPLETFRLQGDL